MADTETENGEYITMPFGDLLKYLRGKARPRMTQEHLADLLGIAQNTISTWERRARPPEEPFILSEMAAIFRVDVEDLRAGRIRRAQSEPPPEQQDDVVDIVLDRLMPHVPPALRRTYIENFDALDPETQEQVARLAELWVRHLRAQKRPKPPKKDQDKDGPDGMAM
jgi:transcriptional regulator with XRE-family HTH domain